MNFLFTSHAAKNGVLRQEGYKNNQNIVSKMELFLDEAATTVVLWSILQEAEIWLSIYP